MDASKSAALAGLLHRTRAHRGSGAVGQARGYRGSDH